ncbi:hypothetical protein P0136_11440 [Lentisphaerota bacterium ZTH]|nr:hypothetical protein JYG24_11040 [Lentisphaerota bacterium]WET05971.1 hypothetical protein P0136_11440 [Lentisphaerota bacterium ZTH]
MRIVHQNNIDFSIEVDGSIKRRSVWQIMPDENFNIEQNWPAFRQQAEAWAGSVGDAWRQPAADSRAFTEDPDFIISSIDFKSVNRYIYEVSYSGVKKHSTAEMLGGVSVAVNNCAEIEKSASWRIHADNLQNWLPAIGDVISWAGENYLCSALKLQEAAGGEWQVAITAKDMSILQTGNPGFTRNHFGESVATGKWRVSLTQHQDFLDNNNINSPAPWAGEGYFVSNISSSPDGKLGYYVSLEAKHVNFKLLDVKRSESFKGYASAGTANLDICWTGRWRIHRDNLSDYENIAGSSAEEWAAPGAIITKIDPIRITDVMYEVVLEARVPEASSGFAAMNYNGDDRSNLQSRTDVHVENIAYQLTHRECGWREAPRGYFIKLEDWNMQLDCPFITSGQLPVSMVEKYPKCTKVTESKYLKGSSVRHVQMTLDWNNSGKVFNAKVGGVYGKWLKGRIDTAEVFDNLGERWTKVSRSYLYAPENLEWNHNYRGF